jgi:2-polyprenyl-6-methoxyphenol hydroxylase-like FAD-dependent oxidoreductase
MTLYSDAAQGGAQGLEDAAALGELLPRDIPPAEINTRLHLFEETRRPRCTAMQLNSYLMGLESPLVKGDKRESAVIASALRSSNVLVTETTDHFHMALTYDAVTAAREALATHLAKE